MRRYVFNSKKWNGRDVGDNTQFWEQCTVLQEYRSDSGEFLAVVQWPDGSVTRGHFMSGMLPAPPVTHRDLGKKG